VLLLGQKPGLPYALLLDATIAVKAITLT